LRRIKEAASFAFPPPSIIDKTKQRNAEESCYIKQPLAFGI
jgi:hypothetical protein